MDKRLEILNKYIDFSKDGVIEREQFVKAMQEYADLQLQQTSVSGSTYGFTIEFKHVKNKTNVWDNHWNHKIYRTKEIAEEAITQMKKQYEFYRNDYNWRIVELYCH